jgi:outer membrane protein assembly factor BamA
MASPLVRMDAFGFLRRRRQRVLDGRDRNGQLLDLGFSASELRASAGVGTDLLLPFGTVRLSYAVPLRSSEDNADAMLRDRVERFQVSFGVDF